MVDLGDIEIIKDAIAFQFHEHVNSSGMFDEVGGGIIQLANNTSHYLSANSPRKATVIKVGPDVRDPRVVPGATIVVAPLRWSLGLVVPGTDAKVHFTNERECLAVIE